MSDIIERAERLIEEMQAAINESKARRGVEVEDTIDSPFLVLVSGKNLKPHYIKEGTHARLQ